MHLKNDEIKMDRKNLRRAVSFMMRIRGYVSTRMLRRSTDCIERRSRKAMQPDHPAVLPVRENQRENVGKCKTKIP